MYVLQERKQTKSESSRSSTPSKRSMKKGGTPQKGPSPPKKKAKVEKAKDEEVPVKPKKPKFKLKSLLPPSERVRKDLFVYFAWINSMLTKKGNMYELLFILFFCLFFLLKGQRPVAEFRCPYCTRLYTQRNELTKHLKAAHGDKMKRCEKNGFLTGMTRAENLRKPGARVIDRKRVFRHLKDVRSKMSPADFGTVWLAVRRILCEAMVILGEESEFTHRRYQQMKAEVAQLLK